VQDDPQGDRNAIADERLQVHGLERLRVVDASIMPNVISANTNVPTMMIAAKASQTIRANYKAGAARTSVETVKVRERIGVR
jgi:choline dehydrogenase-like flavoprotein